MYESQRKWALLKQAITIRLKDSVGWAHGWKWDFPRQIPPDLYQIYRKSKLDAREIIRMSQFLCANGMIHLIKPLFLCFTEFPNFSPNTYAVWGEFVHRLIQNSEPSWNFEFQKPVLHPVSYKEMRIIEEQMPPPTPDLNRKRKRSRASARWRKENPSPKTRRARAWAKHKIK